MASRMTAAVVLLALLNACASQRVVRLDTGQEEPLEHRPPLNKFVKVDEEAFEEALTQLVLEVPLTLRPPQRGWFVRASYPGKAPDTRWQSLMSKSFGGICEPGQRRANCLSLLDDVMGLSAWDKLGVALGLSIDPLKESISKAVEKTLAPQLFYTVIATGLISWAVLAANPEPVFTKAAAIVSAALLIYLGVETFLELVDASRELKWVTDRSTTWEELERASERFANRAGPEVARVFVLAVTVVVSHGMTGGSAWLASRLAMLPSFSEAAALGASQLRLTLSEIGQVSAVAVSAEGTITMTLAPTVVAMTGQGPGGGSKLENQKPQTQEQYKTPTSGVSGKEGAKDVPSWAKGERPKVNESGKDFAKRLLDKKYGEGNYDKGPGSEFNKIQKWGDRAFENP
ncbi:hypothetical protein [Stigmatella erecta]|uniref:Lipoprotein n=1 Tax=Stigmatella erecta TaxID=83460 RepID=A0A1I0LFC2_9BACT|nr:hypothetical protein [Stigmatella erecta]SEU38786.1 hypothetical protein SAMN05443639_12836 [Stigmatella erecta]